MRGVDVLLVIWRRKGIVLVLVVVVLAAAGWSLSNAPDDYESRAKVALLPDPANPQLVPFYGQAVENLLPTYAEIVESQTFLDGIADRLPFETTGSELSGAVRAQPVSRIGVLDIVATSPDADRAQQIARATADGLVLRLADNGIVNVSLLDEPRVPTEPIAPSTTLVFAVALLVGLTSGGAAAVVWDRFFGRVNTAAQASEISDLPVLSVLPEARRMHKRRIVVGRPELHELEESLRGLRTNILFGASDDRGGSTIITGLSPGDGKSMVAANLAILTAELGVSVLLVDADLHRPVQHEVFGVSNELGLTSVVEFGSAPEKIVVSTGYENLRLVPAGPPIGSRAKELRVYLETMGDFNKMADVIIIDSPPLRAGDEVRLLAALAQRVVLLVRAGATSPRDLHHAVESLRSIGGEMLGLVLTRTDDRQDEAMKHYRYYRAPGQGPGSASTEVAQSTDPREPSGVRPTPRTRSLPTRPGPQAMTQPKPSPSTNPTPRAAEASGSPRASQLDDDSRLPGVADETDASVPSPATSDPPTAAPVQQRGDDRS